MLWDPKKKEGLVIGMAKCYHSVFVYPLAGENKFLQTRRFRMCCVCLWCNFLEPYFFSSVKSSIEIICSLSCLLLGQYILKINIIWITCLCVLPNSECWGYYFWFRELGEIYIEEIWNAQLSEKHCCMPGPGGLPMFLVGH